MRRRVAAGCALVVAAALGLTACASANPSRGGPSASTGASSTPSAHQRALRCPVTNAPITPRAGTGTPLPPDPTGARACFTNEAASKRASIGTGEPIPANTAATLAELIDRSAPATEAMASQCVPSSDGPQNLTRFRYPSGERDVTESSRCHGHDLAYVSGHAYLLAPALGSYLGGYLGAISPDYAPEITGLPLAAATKVVLSAHDTLLLDGTLISSAPLGTVLLQTPTNAHQVDVIVAVRPSTVCRSDQLAVQYLPGGAGTGSDFGEFLIRNVGGSWCELDGSVNITGLSASGTRATPTASARVTRGLELSPHAAPAVLHHGEATERIPAGQLAATVELTAGYRDDPVESDGLCTAREVVPVTWRMELASTTLDVPNGRGTADARPPGAGGLITCRGAFETSAVGIATP